MSIRYTQVDEYDRGELMHSAGIRRGFTKKDNFAKDLKKEETYFAKKINLQKEENAKIILTGEVTREDEGITVLMAACHQV